MILCSSNTAAGAVAATISTTRTMTTEHVNQFRKNLPIKEIKAHNMNKSML
jgi:hypothetical protein